MIVDTRQTHKNRAAGNKQRFIQRYKRRLRKLVDEVAERKSIKDLADNDGFQVFVNEDDCNEPEFTIDRDSGDVKRIIKGDTKTRKGQKYNKQNTQKSPSGSGADKGGKAYEEDFAFYMSREEFLSLYFAGLELPNFLKSSLNKVTKFVYTRAGFSKHGVPAKLNLKKTLEQAIGRRIAFTASIKNRIQELLLSLSPTSKEEIERLENKKPTYLDDIDLRYNLFQPRPKPARKAVIFMFMDVSGSMTQEKKLAAKKFYTLLYLFLTTVYKEIEIRFIRYHHTAEECDEKQFFYGRETGGTDLALAYKYMNDLIEHDYNDNTNVYVSHVSDGDYVASDTELITQEMHRALNLSQALFYIELPHYPGMPYGNSTVYRLYSKIKELTNIQKLFIKVTEDTANMYMILVEFFKKRG